MFDTKGANEMGGFFFFAAATVKFVTVFCLGPSLNRTLIYNYAHNCYSQFVHPIIAKLIKSVSGTMVH